MRLVLCAVVVVLASAACSSGDDGPDACLANRQPGLRIVVVDEVGIRLSNATVIATDGTYMEMLTLETNIDGPSYTGASERGGTYDILVSAPRYMDVRIDDVTVTENVCHPNTVNLTVTMIRST